MRPPRDCSRTAVCCAPQTASLCGARRSSCLACPASLRLAAADVAPASGISRGGVWREALISTIVNEAVHKLKNLLILTSRYPHNNDSLQGLFVYFQVEELRKHFEKIVVLSSTPYVPSFFTRWMQPKRKLDSLAKDYDYGNVSVHFQKYIFAISDSI